MAGVIDRAADERHGKLRGAAGAVPGRRLRRHRHRQPDGRRPCSAMRACKKGGRTSRPHRACSTWPGWSSRRAKGCQPVAAGLCPRGREADEGPQVAAIEAFKPTVLIGVSSTTGGAFTQQVVVRAMAKNERAPGHLRAVQPHGKGRVHGGAGLYVDEGQGLGCAAGVQFPDVKLDGKTVLPRARPTTSTFSRPSASPPTPTRPTRITDRMLHRRRRAPAPPRSASDDCATRGMLYPKPGATSCKRSWPSRRAVAEHMFDQKLKPPPSGPSDVRSWIEAMTLQARVPFASWAGGVSDGRAMGGRAHRMRDIPIGIDAHGERREFDSMGDVQVSADKLLGGADAAQPAPLLHRPATRCPRRCTTPTAR